MPLNLEQIEASLVEAGLKYRLEDGGGCGHVLTAFATSCYENAEGQRGVAIVISVSDDGEFLEFTAPRLYDARRCREPGKLYQALLDITMRTKLVRFEHDAEDGEIRATVTYPIEDGSLTRRQFRRMVEAIPKAVDHWHPVIQRAMKEGIVELAAGADLSSLRHYGRNI
jgi:hypothetical protein